MGVSVRIRRTDTPIHQARRPTRGPERAARGPDGSGLLACHLANVDLSSPGRAIHRANCGTRNTTADGRSKDGMGTMLESWSVAFLAAGEGTEQAELPKPREAVLAQGGRPVLVAPR